MMGNSTNGIVEYSRGLEGVIADFYSGIVYHFLGIPRDLFTPVFAMARSVGWAAHVCEYIANTRIFRPRAYYIGPEYGEYVPIEKKEVRLSQILNPEI